MYTYLFLHISLITFSGKCGTVKELRKSRKREQFSGMIHLNINCFMSKGTFCSPFLGFHRSRRGRKFAVTRLIFCRVDEDLWFPSRSVFRRIQKIFSRRDKLAAVRKYLHDYATTITSRDQRCNECVSTAKT